MKKFFSVLIWFTQRSVQSRVTFLEIRLISRSQPTFRKGCNEFNVIFLQEHKTGEKGKEDSWSGQGKVYDISKVKNPGNKVSYSDTDTEFTDTFCDFCFVF